MESEQGNNSNKEDLKEQSKHEGEETDVQTVTINVQEYNNWQDLLVQRGQENVKLISEIKRWIAFKVERQSKLS